jgi:propionate CoA-transferase
VEVLAIAMAVPNSGGATRQLNPRRMKILAIWPRRVAKTENDWQTFGTQYNPAYSRETKVRTGALAAKGNERMQNHCPPTGVRMKANSV